MNYEERIAKENYKYISSSGEIDYIQDGFWVKEWPCGCTYNRVVASDGGAGFLGTRYHCNEHRED